MTLIGIPILVGCCSRGGPWPGASADCSTSCWALDLADPYRPLGAPTSLGRLRERIADPATWKDLVYLFLAFPMGILSFVVTVTTISLTVGLLLAPALLLGARRRRRPRPADRRHLPRGVGVRAAGRVDRAVALASIRALASMHAAVARPSSARARTRSSRHGCRTCRGRAPASSPRPTPSGAAWSATSTTAPSSGSSRSRSSSGSPAGAMAGGQDVADLVAQADEEARLAIAELRDLARGIHPAILTDRGLAAGLRDLAARAGLPVEVRSVPRGAPSRARRGRRPTSWSPRP